LRYFASANQLSWYGTFEQIRKTRLLMYAPHHYLGYIPKPGYTAGNNRHNSLGFRGDEVAIPKPGGVFRIVAIGGSTTYTTFVNDYRQSYPYLLQEVLRAKGFQSVEVVNAGVAGYASWESLMNLQFRVLDLEPDLILNYDSVNDVHPRIVFPYDLYRGDNTGGREAYTGPQETLWDASAVIRILRTQLGFRSPLGGLAFRRTYQYVPGNYALQFEEQKRNGTYPKGIFVEYPASEMLARNRPVYFERNLRNMIAICRENGVQMVLMTFAFSPLFTEEPNASSEEYVTALREHNEVLKRLCREESVPCYDLAAQMPIDRKLFVDGRHVNEEGSRVKAELIAAFLAKSGLLPR
jgi:lysophospholipase L1-like esterase